MRTVRIQAMLLHPCTQNSAKEYPLPSVGADASSLFFAHAADTPFNPHGNFRWLVAQTFARGGWVTNAFVQLVEEGCNVIALSRSGTPERGESWFKSVKWVQGNALVSRRDQLRPARVDLFRLASGCMLQCMCLEESLVPDDRLAFH